MPTYDKSVELAESIVAVGNGAGMQTSALLTDMNEALAPYAGNALEVRGAIDYLTGRSRPARLHEVTLALCAEMLVLGGLAATEAEARVQLEAVLASGAAAERFSRMVSALGGPADLIENPDQYLERAPFVVPAPALAAGFAHVRDCRAIGLAVVSLGGGRRRPSDAIDFAVGLTDLVGLGEPVAAGQPLAMVHARTQAAAQQAVKEIQAAYEISAVALTSRPVIYRTIRP